jgi:hypothetical protein
MPDRLDRRKRLTGAQRARRFGTQGRKQCIQFLRHARERVAQRHAFRGGKTKILHGVPRGSRCLRGALQGYSHHGRGADGAAAGSGLELLEFVGGHFPVQSVSHRDSPQLYCGHCPRVFLQQHCSGN